MSSIKNIRRQQELDQLESTIRDAVSSGAMDLEPCPAYDRGHARGMKRGYADAKAGKSQWKPTYPIPSDNAAGYAGGYEMGYKQWHDEQEWKKRT